MVRPRKCGAGALELETTCTLKFSVTIRQFLLFPPPRTWAPLRPIHPSYEMTAFACKSLQRGVSAVASSDSLSVIGLANF